MVIGELEGGRTAAQIGREHSIEPTLVFRWKYEHSKYPGTAFRGRGNSYTNEAAIAEKDRLIGRLYAENELLKKANQNLLRSLAEQRKRGGQP